MDNPRRCLASFSARVPGQRGYYGRGCTTRRRREFGNVLAVDMQHEDGPIGDDELLGAVAVGGRTDDPTPVDTELERGARGSPMDDDYDFVSEYHSICAAEHL